MFGKDPQDGLGRKYTLVLLRAEGPWLCLEQKEAKVKFYFNGGQRTTRVEAASRKAYASPDRPHS